MKLPAKLKFTSILTGLLAAGITVPAASAEGSPPAQCQVTDTLDQLASYKSVEQLADGRLVIGLCAPEARSVGLEGEFNEFFPLEGGKPSAEMPWGRVNLVRQPDGLWTITSARPVAADSYVFRFIVDGVALPDPQGHQFTEMWSGVFSTVTIDGPYSAFMADNPAIAHGIVSTIEYNSASTGTVRRAHVYTPPGYMKNGKTYPVLYLAHGANGSDATWTAQNRAQYILDNLIAQGKATPMIVVFPASNVPNRPGVDQRVTRLYGKDLLEDLVPYVDANFRTIRSPHGRAMAGYSMGARHTMRYGLPNAQVFGTIGIFAFGLGPQNMDTVQQYDKEFGPGIKAGKGKRDYVALYMGRNDPFHFTVPATRAMLDRFGAKHEFFEVEGTHSATNSRIILADFLPRIFK